MTQAQFRLLQEGDIIKDPIEQEAYIVTGQYGTHITAVRTLDITNYQEWEIVRQQRNKPKEALTFACTGLGKAGDKIGCQM